MFERGIRIPWVVGPEYLPIDLDNIDGTPERLTTVEYWREGKNCVQYNVRLVSIKRTTKGLDITLDYDPKENPQLKHEDIYWGQSRISIEPEKDSGKAVWIDGVSPKNSGDTTWTRLPTTILKDIVKESVSRTKRIKQDEFRAALIFMDKTCAVTGEATPYVLEAAHIVGSSKKGAEVVANGILLRADIHRLFDAGKVNIDSDGMISFNNQLPCYYSKSPYNGKRLDPKILARVKYALELRSTTQIEA